MIEIYGYPSGEVMKKEKASADFLLKRKLVYWSFEFECFIYKDTNKNIIRQVSL